MILDEPLAAGVMAWSQEIKRLTSLRLAYEQALKRRKTSVVDRDVIRIRFSFH